MCYVHGHARLKPRGLQADLIRWERNIAIMELYEAGRSKAQIGVLYKLTYQTIHNVVRKLQTLKGAQREIHNIMKRYKIHIPKNI